MVNIEKFSNTEFGERIEEIKKVVIDGLEEAFKIHELFGKEGEEIVGKNQFGENSLKVDKNIEEAIFDFLKKSNFPVKIISEEHGLIEISKDPCYLGVLDGLDGSGVYKRERGRGRYGTMFGIFNTLDPTYEDYLVSGVMEHSVKRLFLATRGQGCFLIEGGEKNRIFASGKTILNNKTKIHVDEVYEINRKTFSEKLKRFKIIDPKASCISYADVASGRSDLALECTRKRNLEIAAAYGLIKEAGAVMVNEEGKDIGDKKYLDFGQKENLPIITAATKELALSLIKHIKK